MNSKAKHKPDSLKGINMITPEQQQLLDFCPHTHAIVVDSGYAMELYYKSTHRGSFPHLQCYGVSDIDGKRISAGDMAAAYAMVHYKVRVFSLNELTQGDTSMFDAIRKTEAQA